MPFRNFVQTYKMQRLLLIIIASFFLGISCKKGAPAGLLSESKMVDLLVEVHLIDGYLNTIQIDSSRKIIGGLYAQVFTKYGIDSVAFKANMDYYLSKPDVSEKVYKQVNDRLMVYENGYRTDDSLRNVFVSDSLRRQQRFIRMRDDAIRLIMDVPQNPAPLDYKAYRDQFVQQLDMGLNVYGLVVPLMTQPEQVVTPNVEQAKPLEELAPALVDTTTRGEM